MLADPAEQDLAAWAPVLDLAAREVFKLMLSEELVPVPHPISTDQFDVTAMVTLAGRVCGMLSVRCSMRTASLIAAKMLGLDDREARPEALDALGEICNMVAGNFKNKIHDLVDDCMISVPTVVFSASDQVRSFEKNQSIEARFSFCCLPLEIVMEAHP